MNTKSDMRRRKLWIIFSVLLYIFSCSFVVNAQEAVDVNAEASITIRYSHPDTEFAIYKAAEISENYDFSITDQFSGYPIDFGSLDSDEWKNMAETLAGYVSRDEIESLDIESTNDEGILVFENLTVGVYLIIGEQYLQENHVYRSKPFLVFLPEQTEGDQWNYHPECGPKTEESVIEVTDYTVIKIWKDEGKEEKRPVEIRVQLLKDGQLYEEVILNEQNNWRYSWEDLSTEFDWQVVEKEVPEGYTVDIVQEGTVFQVINSTEEEQEIPEKLPQTGQHWWPVPILTLAGLLLILIGLIRRNNII